MSHLIYSKMDISAQNALIFIKKLATELNLSAPLKLVSDSRKIKAGDVFFAYPVGASDGRHYINQAIEQGAVAVIYEANDFDWQPNWQVPHCAVKNLLWQSGWIASAYLEGPNAPLFTVAVTGTNGKTSCTQWIAKALASSGVPSSVIGTLGVGIVKTDVSTQFDVTGFTTPDALQLQQKMAALRLQEPQLGSLAIEASSIGLDQGRMNGLKIDVAVLTNFTRDHLDYHGDMAIYEAAKTRLFNWDNLKTAVVNLDDAYGVRLAKLCRANQTQVFGYCIVDGAIDDNQLTQQYSEQVDVLMKASAVRTHQGGTSFNVTCSLGSGTIKTQLIGRFNVSNVLAVMATLLAQGMDWRHVVQAVEKLESVAGRMEQLHAAGRVLVIIDYAHTPDALEKTLQNLKTVAEDRQGKLWCVFGCGGDRDPGKRPEMGKIAQCADHITSDNPRSEDPISIIEQIKAGISANKLAETVIEVDRAKAILNAIRRADKNDVVLLAGKGHEAYQEIAGKKLPFSDIDHAHIALANLASKGVGV